MVRTVNARAQGGNGDHSHIVYSAMHIIEFSDVLINRRITSREFKKVGQNNGRSNETIKQIVKTYYSTLRNVDISRFAGFSNEEAADLLKRKTKEIYYNKLDYGVLKRKSAANVGKSTVKSGEETIIVVQERPGSKFPRRVRVTVADLPKYTLLPTRRDKIAAVPLTEFEKAFISKLFDDTGETFFPSYHKRKNCSKFNIFLDREVLGYFFIGTNSRKIYFPPNEGDGTGGVLNEYLLKKLKEKYGS